MSTASLSSHIAPLLAHVPLYAAEHQEHEPRIALSDRLRPKPSGNFVKKSKGGDAQLRLIGQEGGATLPTYGSQGSVEGTVQLSKTENVTSVEVKIEGRMRLREVAEGGTTSAKLCLDTTVLWTRDSFSTECPPSLPFALHLPTAFTYEDKTYPLPPTFDVKLSGLPGFTATIDYSVSVTVHKPHLPNLVPLVKSSLLGINLGSTTVTTPFLYYPRNRPAVPIPSPLLVSQNGFITTPEWKVYESVIRSKVPNLQDIATTLYIPASRMFCISQPIPFHVTFESSALSLASFLPLCPGTTNAQGGSTQIQLMRQSTVDVRNAVVEGAKTDIWRVDSVGDGKFEHASDGPTWVSYSGEIVIQDTVKVTGFKAAGLSVKDCILFSVTPPDPQKAQFSELREVVPVRLTTDVWAADSAGISTRRRSDSELSVPSMAEEILEYTPLF